MQEASLENFITDFFKNIFGKTEVEGNRITVDKQNFINSITSSQEISTAILTVDDDCNLNNCMANVTADPSQQSDAQKYALKMYRYIVSLLSPKAKTMEQHNKLSSIMQTLRFLNQDLSLMHSQSTYLLGVGSNKFLNIEDIKLSLAICLGELQLCKNLNDYTFNFLCAITTTKDKAGFLKYQYELLNEEKAKKVAMLINAVISLRKPDETIAKTISKLKNGRNDVYLKVQDKNIVDYLPSNTINELEAFYLTGFYSCVDSLVNQKGFFQNICLGTGRWFLRIWKYREEYDREVRNYLVLRIEQLNTNLSETNDPLEKAKLEEAIADCTDKLAYYNKRVNQYENS